MTRIVRAGSLGPGPGRLGMQRPLPLLLLLASLSQERKHVCLPRDAVNAGDAPRHAVECGPLGQFTSIFARNQKQQQQQNISQVNRSKNSGCMLQSMCLSRSGCRSVLNENSNTCRRQARSSERDMHGWSSPAGDTAGDP